MTQQHDQTAPHQPCDVEVLCAAEHARKRPGMYIGDVNVKGLLWMTSQLFVSSLAEAAEGYGHSLRVKLNADDSIEIEDDGRGFDTASGKFRLEAVLTNVFVPGHGPPGRIWLDYFIVNALSERLLVETRYGGRVYQQEFRRGTAVAGPEMVGSSTASGLKVTFKPDPTIFPDPHLPFGSLRDRLRLYAFLHSGVAISVSEAATGQEDRFEFADGIRSFVQTLNDGRQPLHPEVVVVRGEQAGIKYEVGLQWCRGADEIKRSFVNDYETTLGGTHATGLLAAVTRSVNSFARKQLGPAGRIPKSEMVRKGLTALVSVRMAAPEYAGATKARLVSKEPRRAVGSAVSRSLRQFLTSNPEVLAAVVRNATEQPAVAPAWDDDHSR